MRSGLLFLLSSACAGGSDPRWSAACPWEASGADVETLEERAWACDVALPEASEASGTLAMTIDDEARGPWRLTASFLDDGATVDLRGCVRGSYGNCMSLAMLLSIGQVVDGTPLPVELGLTGTPGRFSGLIDHDHTGEIWAFLAGSEATGTGTVTSYRPADRELAASFVIRSDGDAGDPSHVAADVTLDLDITW